MEGCQQLLLDVQRQQWKSFSVGSGAEKHLHRTVSDTVTQLHWVTTRLSNFTQLALRKGCRLVVVNANCILGRITELRVGQPTHAVSIKCSLDLTVSCFLATCSVFRNRSGNRLLVPGHHTFLFRTQQNTSSLMPCRSFMLDSRTARTISYSNQAPNPSAR